MSPWQVYKFGGSSLGAERGCPAGAPAGGRGRAAAGGGGERARGHAPSGCSRRAGRPRRATRPAPVAAVERALALVQHARRRGARTAAARRPRALLGGDRRRRRRCSGGPRRGASARARGARRAALGGRASLLAAGRGRPARPRTGRARGGCAGDLPHRRPARRCQRGPRREPPPGAGATRALGERHPGRHRLHRPGPGRLDDHPRPERLGLRGHHARRTARRARGDHLDRRRRGDDRRPGPGGRGLSGPAPHLARGAGARPLRAADVPPPDGASAGAERGPAADPQHGGRRRGHGHRRAGQSRSPPPDLRGEPRRSGACWPWSRAGRRP